MNAGTEKETLVERKVTYALEMNGKFFVIENVPARVCDETGEQFFSPQTVERLQQIVREQHEPKRVIETPVYEFAA
jgi:YgiT-type zinc finger domain-containing protein